MQNDCLSLNDGFLFPLDKTAFILGSSFPLSDTVQTSQRETWYWGVGASPYHVSSYLLLRACWNISLMLELPFLVITVI